MSKLSEYLCVRHMLFLPQVHTRLYSHFWSIVQRASVLPLLYIATRIYVWMLYLARTFEPLIHCSPTIIHHTPPNRMFIQTMQCPGVCADAHVGTLLRTYLLLVTPWRSCCGAVRRVLTPPYQMARYQVCWLIQHMSFLSWTYPAQRQTPVQRNVFVNQCTIFA